MNAQTAAPKSWSDLDPYLKAAHLPAGQTVPATVDRIEFTTLHPRPGVEEIKPVMYFQGKQKGLILTSTNQDFLRREFGDEITGSYGKRVTLRAVRKTIAGRGVDTIIIGLPETKPATPGLEAKIIQELGYQSAPPLPAADDKHD